MPEVRNNICIKPLKGKSILSIEKYMKDKKIIVFDLDGTIANTEMLHFKSYQRILSEYGIDFQMKDFESYIGNPEAIIWENMIIDYNLDITVNESILKRTKILLELVVEEDLKPYDYFLQILRTYKTTEKVILSSQIPEVIDFLIDRWGIKDIFTEKRIFSVSDRLHSKFEVLKSLGEFYPSIGSDYSPSEVIIFEDSNHTLKIAKQLGIDSIGIEHQFNHNQLTNCNFILNEEISSGIFIGLAGMDIVHYQDNKLQDENSKSKTDDYAVYVGGPAANAAIVFSQLGGDAILISCIGDSEIGKAIKAMLRRYGVTVIDAMKEENTIPNISSVIVNKSNGNRTIISGQKIYNDRDYKADINIIESADFLMYDCNTPLLFNSNKHIGTNRKIILDAGSYKEHLRDILNDADEVISSAHFKINNQTIIEKQDDYKIKFAAISNGPNPIICRVENSEITYIKPPKVYPVVDTLGAGDALHGAYCFYRFQKKMTYENALTKASEYASKTVQHRGVIKVDDL
jgi:sugar/nucleoside kinase (ribokinase family)/beta-phosphoglucomutase-like phosphatase (HAD superfamily)